ncbi:MAG: histidine phosphatase family protein [Rhodocyclaceae bacterium]|jgi:phosphohistidine phosphatase SixA|nr:histidine phosphatase family protein [Accumulibacter sp.]HNN08677.1 histidine phosphatase family protein [Azospira sp.]HNN46373.1 histidine phosphatase family protein [Azospira sp.]
MAAPFVMLVGMLCAATLYFQFAGPTLLDFGLESPAGMTALAASWAKGEVVVLVRHAERCDRSTAPCPDTPDGITADGKDLAVALGAAFARLGIERADFLTSPLTRTRQTSTYMFGATVPEQAWLANCKTVQVDDIARTKVAGRNLILVTHSHCIEKIEKDLGLAATEPPYGGMLFLAFAGRQRLPGAAGTLDAERFIAGIGAAK